MKPKTEDLIKIENAPAVAGLRFRGYHGETDYPHMAEIINAANRADDLTAHATVADIENTYKHLQGSDPTRDMLFVEIGSQPVGYGRCAWAEEQNGDYIYSILLNMKPEGRLPRLGDTLVAAFMKHLQLIAADHPTDAPKYFQSWVSNSQTQTWYAGVLERHNFIPVRYSFEMLRPCSQPIKALPLPEDIEVRPVSPKQYRQVWDAQTEAFRDHWGFQAPNEKSYQSWLDFPYFDPAIWKVAWDGNEVAGMVLNFINAAENKAFDRQRGYTEFISVRRPWRRRGIARALLIQSIQMFQQMGMEETCLNVDAENLSGALKLYQSVGYREHRRSITYRKDMNERN